MKIFKLFPYIFYNLVVAIIILEVLFTVLPVSDDLKVKPVNNDNPVLRFEENQDVIRQIGFDFQHVNKRHINNFGFPSNLDFEIADIRKKKLIAVIGDSYVEAFQVSNEETFHNILNLNLDNYDVYPFASSGSPLSQYVVYKNYSEKIFNPDLYIFLIISNDFDESLYKFKKYPGHHYFDDNGDLILVEYKPNKFKRFLRNSAFLRYLSYDLKLGYQVKRLFKKKENSELVNFRNSAKYENYGKLAINFFFENIQELSMKKKIILVLDGDRESIYENKYNRDANKKENILFNYLINKSYDVPNIFILDLHPIFENDWKEKKQKFNFEYDYHWNEYAHKIVAENLKKFIDENI